MGATFWGPDFDELRQTDPEIAGVVLGELTRLRGGLQLIASENLTSPAVLAALGSTLTNKYAEGYPGRRYYGGCAEVDRAEQIGIDRAKELFGADHANLQPHSGASANLAAYAALLQPGDPVLAMELPHGGHLTHGATVSFSGTWFRTVGYTVREDSELIDYDEVRDLARQHRPKMIICGATAYPRLIDFAAFRAIADEVGAYLMVDAAHFIGLVAGGAIPSPVPYADVVCFTTHKVLRGPRGGMILCRSDLAARIDKAVFPFIQGGPLMHVIAAKAVALREAAQPAYADYTRQVIANARALAEGLAAQGMRPVSGGTDTHLALIDLRPLGPPPVTGRAAEQRCDLAGITLNKNAIPYDPQKPMVASGIRVGTPSVTTQGMGEVQMHQIADLIARAVRADPDTDAGRGVLADVADEVGQLVAAFPAYPVPVELSDLWRVPGRRVEWVAERTRHLRWTLLLCTALTVVAAIVGFVVAGGAGALGAAVGVALVAVSYTVSTLAIAWADTVNPQLVFPVGMGMYVTKFSLLGVMLVAVGATEWAGKIPMAMGIVAGVVAWIGSQIWWTVHHAHPYVSVR